MKTIGTTWVAALAAKKRRGCCHVPVLDVTAFVEPPTHAGDWDLRVAQLLLGHSKIESTVRYHGVEIDDALDIAEKIEV
jgi:hypothetical protein